MLETLEGRRLLASDTLGGVSGTVFIDAAAVSNAQVTLYRDSNNSNSFDAGDVLVDTDTTDGSGRYSFTGLTSDNYFAVQPAQTVGGTSMPQRVSPRLAVDGSGAVGVTIDSFDTVSPDTTDIQPPGTPVNSVNTAPEALGGNETFEPSSSP